MAKFTLPEIQAEISNQAEQFGIPATVANAILFAENSGKGSSTTHPIIDGATTSEAGARGVMQTMPRTEEGLKRLGYLPANYTYHPDDLKGQISAGLATLKEMASRQKMPGNWEELATMYHGGDSEWKKFRAGEPTGPRTTIYREKVKQALGATMNESQGITLPDTGAGAGRGSAQASQVPGQSQRVSSSNSYNVYDPLAWSRAMGVVDDYTKNGGDADTAARLISEAETSRQIAQGNQERAITQYGLDKGAFEMATASKQARDATRMHTILTDANLDVDQANNLFTTAQQKLNTLTAQAEPLGKEIDARQAVGFFDNPLMYLVNQVRLPGMTGQYNSLVREANRAIETTHAAQGMANTQRSVSTGIDADKILEEARAKTAMTASGAQADLAAAQERGSVAAAQAQANILGATTHKADIALRGMNATSQRISESESTSDRAANKDAEKVLVDRVNNWLKIIGSDTVYNAATFKSLGEKERTYLQQASGRGIISDSFSHGFAAIRDRGSMARMNNSGSTAFTAWVDETAKDAAKETNETFLQAEAQAKITGKVINKQEHFNQILDNYKTKYIAQTGDMRSASANNPYKIAYAAIAQAPELQDNIVTKYINTFGPRGDKSVTPRIDEAIVLDNVAANVAAGNLTLDSAAQQIKQFYTTATRLQRDAAKYGLFDMKQPDGYTIITPTPGMFSAGIGKGAMRGDERTVDMMNYAQVAAVLNRMVALRGPTIDLVRQIQGDMSQVPGGIAP
jgi:Transglycosylase SLT domain